MTIKAGDRLPSVTLHEMGADGPQPVTTDDLCRGRRVVLFGVPGAFTPTCSNAHVPGFLANAHAIKAKGVDEIACLSVNDAFVMGAWANAQNTGTELRMLADGDGTFAEAAGLVLDLTGHGLGVRSQRFAIVASDGVVESVEIEPDPTQAEATGAARTLEHL